MGHTYLPGLICIVRESSETLLVPPRPIRQIASDGIAAVDVSVAALSEWGVRLSEASRLHQARAVLSTALDDPSVRLDRLGGGVGLHALEVAYDFRDISSSLPGRRVATVRKELERSLSAPLDPDPVDRHALQTQSQYLVVAALHRAGVELEYPTHSPQKGIKSPEVIAINGMAAYAVEVKRPQSPNGLLARVADAAAQIESFGLEGGILVDLTDVVRLASADAFDAEARAQAIRIYREIWVEGVGARPGFSKVMVGGGFARRAWYIDHGEPPLVKIQTHSSVARFAMTPNTLRDHHGDWLRGKFHEGMRHLGFAGE